MLEKVRQTFEHEQQSNRSRNDCQQADKRKKRILLEIDFYESLLSGNDEPANQVLADLKAIHHDAFVLQVLHAFLAQDNEQFGEALIGHLQAFRNTPYAEEMDYFVLVMESLYQKRTNYAPLDFADAPALFLDLPECEVALIEKNLNISCPSFDIETLLPSIDKDKIGPKFKPY